MSSGPSSKSALRWFLLQLPLWSLLVLLVGAALLVLLLRFLLPQVDSLRPDFEAWLNPQLPFNLQSEHLSASLHRIDPRLVIDELSLVRNDQTFLELKQLEAELDTRASLFALAPRMKEVRLQQLEIRFEETEAAGWQLAGWKPSQNAAADSSNQPIDQQLLQILRWLELLLVQGELDFTDISIQLDSLDGEGLQLSAPHLNYRRWKRGRQLDFQLGLKGQEASSRLVITLKGEDFDAQNSQLDVWLHLDRLQAEDWHFIWPESWQEHLGLPRGNLDLQAWLHWDQGQADLELRSKEAHLELALGRFALEDLAISFKGHAKHWQADWQLAALDWSGQVLNDLQGRLHHEQEDWQLLLKSLSLNELTPALIGFRDSPAWLVALLDDLQPQGSLHDVHLAWGSNQPWQLTSRLQAVGVNAWSAAPQVGDLDAWLTASAQGGQVTFLQQPLNLHFPALYTQPFRLSSGQGEVSWRLDEGEVWVEGKHLVAALPLPGQQAVSQVSGDFSLQLSDHDRRLYLNLGLQPTQIEAHQQLVPGKLLPAAVGSWLEAALGSGQVDQAGFLFAGSIQEASDASFQVQVDFSDARLGFDSSWPALEELAGWVRIDQGLVMGEVAQGRLLAAQLEESYFSTHWQEQGQRLDLSAAFTSELNQFSELIPRSPLQTWLPEPLHAWDYQGEARGRLQLSLPFYDRPEDLQVDLTLDVDAGHLYLSQAQLPLEALEGQLHFNLDQGLQGSYIGGHLWEQPFSAKIEGQDNRLLFSTQAEVESLTQWLGWPEGSWAKGTAAVQGEWPLDPLSSLQVRSSLQGVSLNLPGVYTKPKTEALDLAVTLGFDDVAIPWSLSLGDQLAAQGHLAQPEAGILVNYASQQVVPGELPGRPGIHLDLKLDALDLNQVWQARQLVGEQNPVVEDRIPVDEFAGLPAAFRQLTARVNKVSWQEMEGGPLYFQVNHQHPSIQAQWISDLLIGEATWEGLGQPVQLDLQRLKLPAFKTSEKPSLVVPRLPGSRRAEKLASRPQDSLADFKPEYLPDINWTLSSLERNNQFLGQWQGIIRSRPGHLAISQVKGQLGASNAEMDLSWTLQPDSRTWLNARVEGQNIAPALASITAAKAPLVSQEHLFEGRVSWPGSPAAFYLADLKGDVELLLKKGSFPETDGAALGASRLLGLMNLDHLLRRLRFDFSDVTSEGISFDRLEASYRFEEGYLRSNTPTLLQSSATRVRLSGEIDLLEETLDQQLRVTLPVGQTLPLSAVILGAPQVGAAIWLGQKLVGQFFDTSREALYDVQGPIGRPEVKLKQVR